jgi:hypothetical protein
MSGRANTTAHSEWSAPPDKSFVATKEFSAEFYQYTASRAMDFSMVGTLVLHKDANASHCPAGRVLHANGKKLIPGVNPMTEFTAGATVTSAKFMLGVYDPQSMLNGFIDPTSSTFAVYDKNRPASAYLAEATGNLSEETATAALGGQGAKLLSSTNLAGLIASDDTGPYQTVPAGSARSGTILLNQIATSVTVSSTAVTANSLVLLSVIDITAAAGTFAVLTVPPSAGSFTFATNPSDKTVQFVVVN